MARTPAVSTLASCEPGVSARDLGLDGARDVGGFKAEAHGRARVPRRLEIADVTRRPVCDHSPVRTSARITHITSICLALVVGCATGAVLDDIIVPARAGNGPGFEYTVIDVQATFGLTGGSAKKQQDLLNQYGVAGWRVVGSLGNKLYFMRDRGSGGDAAELPPVD